MSVGVPGLHEGHYGPTLAVYWEYLLVTARRV